MQTVALWEVLSLATDPDLRSLAPDVEDVFKYIVTHPAKHFTPCRFVINSDWGEIGLLTPSSFITQDPQHPPDKDFVVSSTKVSWGRDKRREFKRDVIVE